MIRSEAPPGAPRPPPTRWLSSGAGSSDPCPIAARLLTAAPGTVPPADYDAIICTSTSHSTVRLTQASLVPLGPALASAGYYLTSPLPLPADSTQTAWGPFTNITGLVAGSTRLGDELSLLYSAETIAGSMFATVVDWVWNGSAVSGS